MTIIHSYLNNITDLNQTIKREAHLLRYGLIINGSYCLDKEFTNAFLCNAKSVVFTPKIYFSYKYGDLLPAALSFGLSYNEFNYTNSSLKSSSNIVHRIKLQTTNYWSKNLIIGNDFEYTYNSNISDDFKKDFYLWNTSLSHAFFDKK